MRGSCGSVGTWERSSVIRFLGHLALERCPLICERVDVGNEPRHLLTCSKFDLFGREVAGKAGQKQLEPCSDVRSFLPQLAVAGHASPVSLKATALACLSIVLMSGA